MVVYKCEVYSQYIGTLLYKLFIGRLTSTCKIARPLANTGDWGIWYRLHAYNLVPFSQALIHIHMSVHMYTKNHAST